MLWARKAGPAGWDALRIEGRDGSVIVSLASRPASAPSPDVARKELLQAGMRAKQAAP